MSRPALKSVSRRAHGTGGLCLACRDAASWNARTLAEIRRLEGLVESERQRADSLESALQGLLPLAQERAFQFRKYADDLARFARETGMAPAGALEAKVQLRQAESAGAELLVEQARQALKGAGHGA